MSPIMFLSYIMMNQTVQRQQTAALQKLADPAQANKLYAVTDADVNVLNRTIDRNNSDEMHQHLL